MGKSSPTSGNGNGGTACRASDELPIPVPAGVDVTIDGQHVTVKGPKGTLSHTVAEPITVAKGEDGTLLGHPPGRRARVARSLHGLTRTLVDQHGHRRDRGLHKTLEIVGAGYRVQAKGSDLEFALGFSHPVAGRGRPRASPSRSRPRPSSRVEGIDKQQVGEVAANIRKLRKPDPYKGKGVRYAGEVIRRKVGKAGK